MNCQIAERIFHLFHLLQENERQPRDFGNGILLYHSDVVFLDCVSQNPGANVSRLSQQLRLTKGAVTQAYQKLREKGLIEMYKRENNKKEKYFRLTSLGEETKRCHERFHAQANKRLCDYIGSLDSGQVEVIFSFLEQMQECMPFCEFSCHGGTKKTKEAKDETGVIGCPRLACRA